MMRRALRLVLGFVLVAILILAATAAALYLGGARWVVNRALAGLNPYPGTSLAVGGVGGSLIRTVVLRDLRFRTGSGETSARVEHVRLRYTLAGLLADEIVIDEVALGGITVHLRRRPDGSWDLPRQRAVASKSPSESPRRIRVRRIFVSQGRGEVELRNDGGSAKLSLERLEGRAHDLRIGGGIEVELDTVSLRLHPPSPHPESITVAGAGSYKRRQLTITGLGVRSPASSLALQGTALFPGGRFGGLRDLALTLTAPTLALRDLRGVHRRFDQAGAIALDLRAAGAADRITFRLDSRLSDDGGSLSLEGSASLPGAGLDIYSVRGKARRLDIARIAGRTEPLEPVDAEVVADLLGYRPERLNGTASLDLRGPVRATLAARFVDGEADIDLTGDLKASRLDVRGTVRPFDSVPPYRLRGAWRPPTDFAGGKLSPVKVRLEGRGGEARLWSTAGLAGGTVSAEGALTLGSELRYDVRRGTIERVGIPAGSSLNARFTLRGSGTSPSAARAEARIDLLSSTIATRRIDSVRADLAFRDGRVRVHAEGVAEATEVALDADVRPFDATPSILVRRAELHRVDLPRLFPALGVAVSPSADVSGSLADGLAVFQAEVRDSSALVTLRGIARPLDPVPTIELEDVRFEEVNVGRLLNDPKFESRLRGRLTGRARGTSLRDAVATATLDLEGSEVRGTVLRTGRARATLKGGVLNLVGAVASGQDSLALEATAESVRTRVLASGTVRGIRLDTALAVGRLGDGGRYLDTLSVRSNIGEISGSGAVPSNLRVAGRLNDLTPLAPLLGLDSLASDSVTFTAALTGPDDALAVDLAARADALLVGETRVGEVAFDGTGRLEPDRTSLESGRGTIAMKRVSHGSAVVESAALEADYAGRALAVTAGAVIDRDRSARIVGRWDRKDTPEIHLDSVDLQTRLGRWALAHPVDITYADRIGIGDLVLSSGAQRIAVDGVIDRKGEQAVHARVDSVRVGPLAQLFGVTQLDGHVEGAFDLRGPATAPRATGELSVAFLSTAKRLGHGRGTMDWDSLGLHLELGLVPPKGDSVTVKGVVPVALSLAADGSPEGLVRPVAGGSLNVDARTEGFRIEALEPLLGSENITDPEGVLSMDVAVRGTVREPQINGSIRLKDAKVEAPRLGTTYRGRVEASLTGREVHLTAASLRAGGGDARATGSLHFEDSARVRLDLDAALREFQIANSKDFGSKLTGELHLEGTSTAPELSGKLTTENTYFYLTAGNSEGGVEDVELSPKTWRRSSDDSAQPPRAGTSPGLFEASGLDLDVAIGANNWIRRRSDPVVAVELDGGARHREGARGKLDVRGDIRALPGRSFVEMVGRRFELMRGGAQLNGPLEKAHLALGAEYHVSTQAQSSDADVTITADVTADTGSIAVTLGSRPSMEQRDIMSYLLTGAPATTDPTMETAGTDALATGTSLAVGAALGTIAGSAGQQLGFDVVQIRQDMQGAQTLVAGKYVSPDLYLGFRQPLSAAVTKDHSEESVSDVMEFEVEYAAFRDVLLNLQGAGSEFRVFLRLRGGD